MIDCMIAAAAWRHGAALLCLDVDREHVATVIGIRTRRRITSQVTAR